jgi:2-iminobutanoate/2-iminopropanoate deaminase
MKKNILMIVMTSVVITCGFVMSQRQAAGQKTAAIERRVVKLPGAPPLTVPISPAIVAGDFVFTSGQLGFDPKTGQMAGPGFEEQAEQVLLNLTAVLEAAGSNTSRVVKTTVFLTDLNDYAAMNEVYRRHFKQDAPGRSAVQVAKLPANARIEIEAVALLK